LVTKEKQRRTGRELWGQKPVLVGGGRLTKKKNGVSKLGKGAFNQQTGDPRGVLTKKREDQREHNSRGKGGTLQAYGAGVF